MGPGSATAFEFAIREKVALQGISQASKFGAELGTFAGRPASGDSPLVGSHRLRAADDILDQISAQALQLEH